MHKNREKMIHQSIRNLQNKSTNKLCSGKRAAVFITILLICCACFANDNLYQQARTLQREGSFNEAIESFKKYLLQPIDNQDLSSEQLTTYTEALLQLMNTFQSKGEPDACISTLQEVFKSSAILQKQCLRDYYSVLGYALSRTERMKEAEETMIKALTLPLYQATPERYFRDYAYAAAVFYSNPDYQNEVMNWCEEALQQAELCKNTSGKQWVISMLGSLYKRNGKLNEALKLFQQSMEEAEAKNDDLGMLNSLNTLIDLFLYWNIPEYANQFASKAIGIEKGITTKNPTVSAQTYINKGWALYQLGKRDSVSLYVEVARDICRSLPYNSGMVDVNLLHGTCLTDEGGSAIAAGIEELKQVTAQGTDINRAKAYHQLGQTYLKNGDEEMAETMLDSLYHLINKGNAPAYIKIDYQPILEYYLKSGNQKKTEKYINLMLQEEQAFKTEELNFNLVETIINLQTEQKRQELEIFLLKQTNQRLWLINFIVLSAIILAVVVMLLFYQKKQHKIQMKQADYKLTSLVRKLNQSNAEKEMRAQEIRDFLKDRDNRQKLETITPAILQTDGESKFRQCFELLHPLLLPRLREKVPSVTRREELLSMLIVLNQDNKRIAELLGIAPRSVLMLRHRFRQKIGLGSEYSLENFLEDIISPLQDQED